MLDDQIAALAPYVEPKRLHIEYVYGGKVHAVPPYYSDDPPEYVKPDPAIFWGEDYDAGNPSTGAYPHPRLRRDRRGRANRILSDRSGCKVAHTGYAQMAED
jgi:hypothetical protein